MKQWLVAKKRSASEPVRRESASKVLQFTAMKTGGGETRLGEELDPVNVMVIGHVALNYPIPSNDSHLYTWGTVTEVSLGGY
jgi:hypothetical protein